MKAFVYSGDSAIHEELALKFGERAILESEFYRYDKHVGPLPDGVAAQLRWRATTGNLAGAAYSWVGDAVDDAEPFGPTLSANLFMWGCRRRAIQRLFSSGLDRWYSVYRSGTHVHHPQTTLVEYYTASGGLWYRGLNSLQDLSLPPTETPHNFSIQASKSQWHFETLDQILPDPVEWLGKETKHATLGSLCPSHGDLHVGNVFLLPDESPRLIDFGRTTLGHIWRDFTALEASVRLTCVGDMDPFILKAAEDTVASARTLAARLDYRSMPWSRDLAEAIRTTTVIRRQASLASGGIVSRETFFHYIVSLVLQLVKYACGEADEIPSGDTRLGGRDRIRRWHAAYAAAVATQQALELRS